MFRPHSTSEPSADIYFQVFACPTATRESPIRYLDQRWSCHRGQAAAPAPLMVLTSFHPKANNFNGFQFRNNLRSNAQSVLRDELRLDTWLRQAINPEWARSDCARARLFSPGFPRAVQEKCSHDHRDWTVAILLLRS